MANTELTLLATAPAQNVCTFNKADSTWLWAWDNPSSDEKLTAHVRPAKDFGGSHGPAQLLEGKFKIIEVRRYQGAYRGPSDGTIVFITFGEPTVRGER